MNKGNQLPHAGRADTFLHCQKKYPKNASFHKAIASIVHSRTKMLFLSQLVMLRFKI